MAVILLKADKVKYMIDNNEFDLILDLRDKEDYLVGHLPNAVNIPINEIPDNMCYLNEYMNKNILIYCGVGHHSKIAGKILTLNGFKKIYDLSNGIEEYKYDLVQE